MRPAKISQQLFTYSKLRIRFHVKIDNDGHKEYDFNNKVYTHINYQSHITMEIVTDNNLTNDMSHSMMITERNMFAVVNFLNKTINHIYRDDLYAMQNKKLILYDDIAKQCREVVQTPTGILMSKPTIIYDENEMAYEGVSLFINNTHNMIDIPIDSLEAIRYNILKVDFILYTNSILNYYINYYKVNEDNPTQTNNRFQSNKKHIDWNIQPDKSYTTATFNRGKDEFDTLLNP